MRDPQDEWSTRLLDPLLRHQQTDRTLLELATHPMPEIEQTSRQLGMNAATLRALAARGFHPADLLLAEPGTDSVH